MEKVKIKLEGGIMPTLGSKYAAAYDLYCPADIVLKRGRQTVDLGFCIELPLFWKANIRSRSGFASEGMEVSRVISFNDGTAVTDSVRIDADVLLGLGDCDYRGHVGVTINVHAFSLGFDLISKFEKPFVGISHILAKGTRFAQMEVCRGDETELVEVDSLDNSNDRGGGFGHTGIM